MEQTPFSPKDPLGQAGLGMKVCYSRHPDTPIYHPLPKIPIISDIHINKRDLSHHNFILPWHYSGQNMGGGQMCITPEGKQGGSVSQGLCIYTL